MTLVARREGEPIPDSTRPDTVRSRVGNGYKIETFRWGTDAVLLRSLQDRAAEVYDRSFNLSILQTADEIYHQMRRDPAYRRSVTLASLPNGRDIGFIIQELVTVPLPDGSIRQVVWNDSRAVDKRHKRKGIATALLRKGYTEYVKELSNVHGESPKEENKLFGAAGRTPNELIIASLISSDLFDTVIPFHRGYNKGPERELLKYFASEVVLYKKPVNERTGVVKRAYPEREVSEDMLDLSHPRVRAIHERFIEIGVYEQDGLKHGNAVFYLALNKNYSDNVSATASKAA